MDGYEVARHIRKDPRMKEVYLVAMTGYGQEEDRGKSQQADFDRHLIKPVEADGLKKLLSHVQPPEGSL